MPRVLLLLPTTTYRTEAFLRAARQLRVDVTAASELPNALARANPAGLLTLDFADPENAARQAVEFAATYPIDAVVPVDSQVVVVAAAICRALGLRHNSVESAAAAQNKYRMRELFARAGVPSPRFRLCTFGEDRQVLAREVEYPCVVKPLSLAASQGVMRANGEEEMVCAVERLERMIRANSMKTNHAPDEVEETCDAGAHAGGVAVKQEEQFLVEQFVSGPEVALEGMLSRGRLHVLALFDKPDSLEGPFFEETIYVTPSRLPDAEQMAIAQRVEQAAHALGLSEGPLHAELRLAASGPVVIEVNARSIGGLCSRVLRFGTGMSLEELIIRHSLSMKTPDSELLLPEREPTPAGVMMIPIPRAGRLVEVRGVEQAKATAGVEDVTISAHRGQQLVPLPEGSRYLGFIFARGESPASVEATLRAAHECLQFVIEPPSAADSPTSLSEK
jgi:biotin carboxylase